MRIAEKTMRMCILRQPGNSTSQSERIVRLSVLCCEGCPVGLGVCAERPGVCAVGMHCGQKRAASISVCALQVNPLPKNSHGPIKLTEIAM